MRIKTKGLSETFKHIEGHEKAIQAGSLLGIHNALMELGVKAAFYAGGPRPKRLGIISGKLTRSLAGRYSYHGLGTYGKTDAIHEIRKSGNRLIGIKGTKVRSSKGFDYPARWEYDGIIIIRPKTQKYLTFPVGITKTGKPTSFRRMKSVTQTGPRPFMQPAVDDIKPLVGSIIQKAVNNEIQKISGK